MNDNSEHNLVESINVSESQVYPDKPDTQIPTDFVGMPIQDYPGGFVPGPVAPLMLGNQVSDETPPPKPDSHSFEPAIYEEPEDF